MSKSLFLAFEARTSKFSLHCAVMFLALTAGLTIFQVVTRFFFGHPSTWSEAAARTGMIWAVLMGVAPTIRSGAMIAVDVIQNALPPRGARLLVTAAQVLSLVFFAVLFWFGVMLAIRVSSQLLSSMNISIAWAYAALPAGSFFAVIALIAQIIRGPQDLTSIDLQRSAVSEDV